MTDKIKKVAVYCGASNKVDDVYKEQALELGMSLAEEGYDLVFGSGNIGLMGVISRTMKEAGREVIGVTTTKIEKMEQNSPNVTQKIIVETLRERKAKMDELCDAVVALPGGIGTLDEVDEMIALKQLGEHNKPIVLFDVNGFWDELVETYADMIDREFAKPEHIALFKVATTVEQVIAAIQAEQKDRSKENWRI